MTPNKEILAYLKQQGFNGLVCIEEASGTGYDGIRKAVEFVRKRMGGGVMKALVVIENGLAEMREVKTPDYGADEVLVRGKGLRNLR